ncbi:MAG: hypothetical protein Q8N98_03720 [bacterium]|nr:hypothetical protein [bacterium]
MLILLDMNTYTYKCADCENLFNVKATLEEKESGLGERPACPKCQSKNIKEHFSSANFLKNIFAGNQGCRCSSGGGSRCGKGGKNESGEKCHCGYTVRT